MRILFLTSAHNGLSQRLQTELEELGHRVTVELSLTARAMESAAELARPDLIICPMLTRRIPDSVWRRHVCLVVHPGIVGDRGPASLDWAILHGERTWGVTVLQAAGELDGGDVWATAELPMRFAPKASIYRLEVTEAATRAVLTAVKRFENGTFRPVPLDYSDPEVRGGPRPGVRVTERRIDWTTSTDDVLRVLYSATSAPGVVDEVAGEELFVYGGWAEDILRGAPGQILDRRHGAVCRATGDGAVWLSHARRPGRTSFKLPAAVALRDAPTCVPRLAPRRPDREGTQRTFRDIWYAEDATGAVGYLNFDFANGAMTTSQCQRLLGALGGAASRPTKVLVLQGGDEFWSTGINLATIETARDPGAEAWRNISAIDDVVAALIQMTDKIVVAALHGNAGAGGVPLALAADYVWCRRGVVLNPHYRSMGELYGSEYWTYLLPRKVGTDLTNVLTQGMQPLGIPRAVDIGLVDEMSDSVNGTFQEWVRGRATTLANDPGLDHLLDEKVRDRAIHEDDKPLQRYREEELAEVATQFFDPGHPFHQARRDFVRKRQPTRTPQHMARHRAELWW
ncbi:MAG: hydrogenase maturation protein [Candidatus Nanopelagicales bacterium]|nr:hydrogenase maturation protein [Candidatus Nanopelagicales bacterium]